MSTTALQERSHRMDQVSILLMIFPTATRGLNTIAGTLAVAGFDPVFRLRQQAVLASPVHAD